VSVVIRTAELPNEVLASLWRYSLFSVLKDDSSGVIALSREALAALSVITKNVSLVQKHEKKVSIHTLDSLRYMYNLNKGAKQSKVCQAIADNASTVGNSILDRIYSAEFQHYRHQMFV
jgi:hypothetical protein